MGHVHVLPVGKEDPDVEPNNWRWLDLIDHLKIKVNNIEPCHVLHHIIVFTLQYLSNTRLAICYIFIDILGFC